MAKKIDVMGMEIDPTDRDDVFRLLQHINARPDGAELRAILRDMARQAERELQEERRIQNKVDALFFQINQALAATEMPGYKTGRIDVGLRIEVRNGRCLRVELADDPEFTDLRRSPDPKPSADQRKVNIGDRVIIKWAREGNPYEVITVGDGDGQLHPRTEIGRQVVGSSIGKTIQTESVIGVIDSIL